MSADRHAPSYCVDCGARLVEGAPFCPQCGASVSESESASNPRPRRSRAAFGERGRAAVRRRGIGSVPVRAALSPLTGRAGRSLYAWYRYASRAARVEPRADGTRRRTDPRSAVASTLRRAAKWVVGAAVAGAAGLFGVAVTAIAVSYGTWRWFRDAERPAAFGRRRTVDAAPADGTATCVVCGESARRGIERTYAASFYVAGVPVRTSEAGSNSYCRECAVRETVTGDGTTTGAIADPAPAAPASEPEPERERV